MTYAEEQLLLNAKKQYRAQIQALIELPTLIPMSEEQRETVTMERDRIALGITKGQMDQIKAMIEAEQTCSPTEFFKKWLHKEHDGNGPHNGSDYNDAIFNLYATWCTSGFMMPLPKGVSIAAS